MLKKTKKKQKIMKYLYERIIVPLQKLKKINYESSQKHGNKANKLRNLKRPGNNNDLVTRRILQYNCAIKLFHQGSRRILSYF